MHLSLSLSLAAAFGGALALAFSFALHRIWRPALTSEFKDLTSFLARTLSGIYGLILALSFNMVSSERIELEEAIDEEVVLLLQIHEDIDEELTGPLRQALLLDIDKYLNAVLSDEWDKDGAAASGTPGDMALENLRKRLRQLEDKDSETAAEIDSLVDAVEQRRLQRLLEYDQRLPPVFWILCFFLFFANLIPLARFADGRSNAALIACYGATIGLVLYSIALLSQPYHPAMPVSHRPFALVESQLEHTRTAPVKP